MLEPWCLCGRGECVQVQLCCWVQRSDLRDCCGLCDWPRRSVTVPEQWGSHWSCRKLRVRVCARMDGRLLCNPPTPHSSHECHHHRLTARCQHSRRRGANQVQRGRRQLRRLLRVRDQRRGRGRLHVHRSRARASGGRPPSSRMHRRWRWFGSRRRWRVGLHAMRQQRVRANHVLVRTSTSSSSTRIANVALSTGTIRWCHPTAAKIGRAHV